MPTAIAGSGKDHFMSDRASGTRGEGPQLHLSRVEKWPCKSPAVAAFVAALALLTWGCDDSRPVESVHRDAHSGDGGPADGRVVDAVVPEQLARPIEGRTLTMGIHHACVITTTNRMVCWGHGAELGRLDHAPQRVTHISANRRNTGAVVSDGSWHELPMELVRGGAFAPLANAKRWSRQPWFETEEDAFPATEVSHGADGACALSADGELACGGSFRTVVYEEEGYYLNPNFGRVERLVWTRIAPHSAWVGCGDSLGRWICWIADIEREPQRGGDPTVLSSASGDQMLLPPDTTHACPLGWAVCHADQAGVVACQNIDAVVTHDGARARRKFDRAPTEVMSVPGIVKLACGSLHDQAVVPAPEGTGLQVCALDDAGRTWCSLNRQPAERRFENVFAREVETNGEAVCVLSDAGKVHCHAPAGAKTIAILAVPVGLNGDL